MGDLPARAIVRAWIQPIPLRSSVPGLRERVIVRRSVRSIHCWCGVAGLLATAVVREVYYQPLFGVVRPASLQELLFEEKINKSVPRWGGGASFPARAVVLKKKNVAPGKADIGIRTAGSVKHNPPHNYCAYYGCVELARRVGGSVVTMGSVHVV